MNLLIMQGALFAQNGLLQYEHVMAEVTGTGFRNKPYSYATGTFSSTADVKQR